MPLSAYYLLVGPGLPAQPSAGLNTDLVYGFWEDGLTWEEAPARVAAAQTFWENSAVWPKLPMSQPRYHLTKPVTASRITSLIVDS